MTPTSIFFNQKSTHRERQKDTAKYAANFFKTTKPQIVHKDNITIATNKSLLMKTVSFIVKKIPLINIRTIDPKHKNADILYTRGDIPIKTNKKYIIELDNPYILTFYNTFAFILYKPLIKKKLLSDQCKQIVCLSKACKIFLEKELGKKVGQKATILYPRVAQYGNKRNNKEPTTKFIFIAFSCRAKGLIETLKAFERIEDNNIELNIIGYTTNRLKQKYKHDKRIHFHGPQKRKDILDAHLPINDILLFPSFYESFGMVALEALSRGLGIITTNTYALPEMVIDGKNGRILPNPYLSSTKINGQQIVDIMKHTQKSLQKKLKREAYNEEFVELLKSAIKDGIQNKTKRKTESSIQYQKKFSVKAREQRFLNIIEKSCAE